MIEVPELARHSEIRVTSHELTSQPSTRFDIDPESARPTPAAWGRAKRWNCTASASQAAAATAHGSKSAVAPAPGG